jgi:DNA-binding NtrC family response regulator
MNVFFQIQSNSADQEILEYIEGDVGEVFISHSTEESISILSEHKFEKAIISLKNLKDVAILKYLNDYYPNTQVVVIANKTFDDVISVFQKLNYSVIHEPLRLSELKGQLHNKHPDIQNSK